MVHNSFFCVAQPLITIDRLFKDFLPFCLLLMSTFKCNLLVLLASAGSESWPCHISSAIRCPYARAQHISIPSRAKSHLQIGLFPVVLPFWSCFVLRSLSGFACHPCYEGCCPSDYSWAWFVGVVNFDITYDQRMKSMTLQFLTMIFMSWSFAGLADSIYCRAGESLGWWSASSCLRRTIRRSF